MQEREKHNDDVTCGINVEGFEFNEHGLGTEMLCAKGVEGDGDLVEEGVVVSHAGMIYVQYFLLFTSHQIRMNCVWCLPVLACFFLPDSE